MTVRIGNVAFDCDDVLAVASLWSTVLERPLDEGGSEWFASIGGADGERRDPSWYFNKVPEPKRAKNRVHLDLVDPTRRPSTSSSQPAPPSLANTRSQDIAGPLCRTQRATSSASPARASLARTAPTTATNTAGLEQRHSAGWLGRPSPADRGLVTPLRFCRRKRSLQRRTPALARMHRR